MMPLSPMPTTAQLRDKPDPKLADPWAGAGEGVAVIGRGVGALLPGVVPNCPPVVKGLLGVAALG